MEPHVHRTSRSLSSIISWTWLPPINAVRSVQMEGGMCWTRQSLQKKRERKTIDHSGLWGVGWCHLLSVSMISRFSGSWESRGWAVIGPSRLRHSLTPDPSSEEEVGTERQMPFRPDSDVTDGGALVNTMSGIEGSLHLDCYFLRFLFQYAAML